MYVCMFGAVTREELELQRDTDREITPALFTNIPLQNPLSSLLCIYVVQKHIT